MEKMLHFSDSVVNVTLQYLVFIKRYGEIFKNVLSSNFYYFVIFVYGACLFFTECNDDTSLQKRHGGYSLNVENST